MAHPFFDTATYPWHRTEAVRLHDALYAAIYRPTEIDQTYRQCAPGLPPLALVHPPNIIWKEALENLTAYTGALRNLCQQPFTNAQLQSAVQDVVNAKSLIHQRITKDNVIILDRVKLREKIELVSLDTTALKVLLVRGSRQSGKSHGRHLMHSAALDRGAVFVYLTSGMVANVKNVIDRLFSAFGALKDVPAIYTTDIAGYNAVCNKLQDVAMEKNKQMWIAVDDLGLDPDGVPLLSSDIKEFFDQFALLLTDPSFSTWFRLMLIHYPEGKLPTKWKRDVFTQDQTSETDVQQGDVAEVLRAWSAARGRNMMEKELLELAADVITNAEAVPPPGEEEVSRLQRINDELRKTLDDLAHQIP